MGLHGKRIAVKTCALISSPMLIGFTKPLILLPEKPIAPDELACIFRHELTHYKKKDQWANLLILLVYAAHWFNPVVFLMILTIRTDREAACDEAVVDGYDIEKRRHYGETILGFVGVKNTGTPVLSTYFYGGSKSMKRRLSTIMDTKKKSKKAALLFIAAVFMATIMFGNALTVSAAPPAPIAPPTPPAPAPRNAYYNQEQPSVTADSAQSAALANVGGGTVARTETHYPPHGGVEYKVIIVYGDYKYCVHVSGYDAGVIDMHADPVVKTGPNAYNASPAVSATSAMSTAMQNAGGGIVTECTLEYKPHNGSLTYHIHVANGDYEYCVELDAATGTVGKAEQRYKP